MKIFDYYRNALFYCGRGLAKCWKCDHKQSGIAMPWLSRQNGFVKVLFIIPAFFIDHAVNLFKAIFYFIIAYLLIVLPLMLFAMLIDLIR